MITEIKQPDLNAPRYRQNKHNILTQDFMESFRVKYPQYINIPDETLKKIIRTHNGKLWETVIDYRDGVEFPENLGYVFIGSCTSPKKFNVDYGNSLKHLVPLRHRNFESDNFLAKIFYTNFHNKYKFKNRELWQFKGVRDFTRTVAQTYPDNWQNYLQVDNHQYISELFKRSIKREYILKKESEAPKEYNEFDLD